MPDESQQEQENKERQVPWWGRILVGVYLVALLGFAFYAILALWPGEVKSTGRFLIWTLPNGTESGWLLLVFAAGVLGGLIHAIRSFIEYIGARKLFKSWLPMYLLLPLLGGALSLVFYIVIRGGLPAGQQLGGEDITNSMSPIGFTAVGVLVGMFSEQAILKLKDVAGTLFSEAKPGADHKPQENTPPDNGDDDPA